MFRLGFSKAYLYYTNFKEKFALRYWILIFIFVITLSIYVIITSREYSRRFTPIVENCMPEFIAAEIGAIIASYINEYKEKSFLFFHHVLYPLLTGAVLFVVILCFSGFFSTIELNIAGNMDGEFNENLLQRVNSGFERKSKNFSLALKLDYFKVAKQGIKESQSVNVTTTYDALLKNMNGGNEYDLIWLDVIWIPYFVKNEYIIPIDHLRGEVDKRHTFGVEHAICRYNTDSDRFTMGKLTYAVPQFVSVGLTMYRVDLFYKLLGKQCEPRSWDELFEWLYEIKKRYGDKYDGYVFQGANYEGLICNYMEMLWANGGDILEKNGIPIVNTCEGINALKFMRKLFDYGITPKVVLDYNEAQSGKHFANGKTLVHRNWPTFYHQIENDSNFRNLKNKVNIMIKPLPFRGVSRSSAKMCLGGQVIAITNDAFKKGKARTAMKAVEFLTGVIYYKDSIYPKQYDKGKRVYSVRVPANKYVVDDIRGDKDALDYAYEYLQKRYYRSRPLFSYYPQFSKILAKYIHKCLNGDYTPENALEKAQDELNNIIPKL